MPHRWPEVCLLLGSVLLIVTGVLLYVPTW
jgi:hypothetical protein